MPDTDERPPVPCHGCSRPALVRYRVVPRQAGGSVWDKIPRDVNACHEHLAAARAIGQVLSVHTVNQPTPATREVT